MKIQLTSYSTLKSQPKTQFAQNRDRVTNFQKSAATKPKQLLFLKKPTKSIFELPKNFTTTPANATANKKGIVLYQQVERNKLFSNGMELMNRFHFKI